MALSASDVESLAIYVKNIANRRAGVMSAFEVDALDRAHDELLRDAARIAAERQGAPRQAGMGPRDHVTEIGTSLRDLGMAVSVGSFVPGGVAVRLDLADVSRWLEPDEAHAIATALEAAAIEAVHEDRARRRR